MIKQFFFVLLGLLSCANCQFELFSQNGTLQDPAGNRFNLKGINWYGLEGENYCPLGLDVQSYTYILDTLASEKFNALRFPISIEVAYNMDIMPALSIDYSLNPELKGKNTIQIMDIIIEEAATLGIVVMIDFHQVYNKYGTSNLWYQYNLDENLVSQSMQNIVSRYKNVWNVVAYDIKNEPHIEATWGSGNLSSDWRLAAQRLGDIVLYQDPRALCFVEGIDGDNSNWGSNLTLAGQFPVILSNQNKLVYSPHVYGTTVAILDWYYATNFPLNMPMWYGPAFGYLVGGSNQNAVVLGEWAINNMNDTISVKWLSGFLNYMIEIGLTDSFYWSINPEVNANATIASGLFDSKWSTPNPTVLAVTNQLNPNPTVIAINNTSIIVNNNTYDTIFSFNYAKPNYVNVTVIDPNASHKAKLLPLYIVGGIFIGFVVLIVMGYVIYSCQKNKNYTTS